MSNILMHVETIQYTSCLRLILTYGCGTCLIKSDCLW